jgi:hypothetical protein
MNPILPLAVLALLLLARRKPQAPAPTAPPPVDTETASGLYIDIAPTGAELDATLRAALRSVVEMWGADVARNVERIYRLETGNFTSELFRITNAAGQKAFEVDFPFGWPARGTSETDYFIPVRMKENSGQGPFRWVTYRKLPTAIMYLARFLKDHGNNAGRWNSTNPEQQASYRAKLARMSTAIVDSVV